MTTSVRREADMTADIVKFRGKGVKFTATAGAITANDYKLTEARIVDGIQLIVKDAAFGDYVKVEVVDVDNIFGYGAGAVLDTFADTWYIASDIYNQGTFRLPYGAEVVAGLYFRVTYTSTGLLAPTVCYNLFAHKYLG